MNTNLPADKQVWIPAERIGQIEVREYVRGDQARHAISISEADLKLPTLVGGFVARNPDNHADQWYIARDYFNKHYRIPVDVSERPCTCHPDDNPPRPCPRKYALTECRKAAGNDASPILDHRYLPDKDDPGFCAKCGSTRASHRGAHPR